jgi:hypothetical protein
MVPYFFTNKQYTYNINILLLFYKTILFNVIYNFFSMLISILLLYVCMQSNNKNFILLKYVI